MSRPPLDLRRLFVLDARRSFARGPQTAHTIDDLRAQAKRRLPKVIYDFVEGGAEDEVTVRRNRDAWAEIGLEPEYLRDVAHRDISTTILGTKVASPVVLGPPDGRSSAHGRHVFKARAGHHLAPQALSDRRLMKEELGRGFTLLAFDVADADVNAFEQAAAALGVPFKTVRDSYADGRLQYETRMILVRPDQFIAWCGDAAPADTAAVMRRVAGRV